MINHNIEQERTKDAAQLANRAVQECNKIKYDQRHKKPTKYAERDFVLIKVLQQKPGVDSKLIPKFKGPSN